MAQSLLESHRAAELPSREQSLLPWAAAVVEYAALLSILATPSNAAKLDPDPDGRIADRMAGLSQVTPAPVRAHHPPALPR